MNAIVLSFDEHIRTWRKWKRKQYRKEHYNKNKDKVKLQTEAWRKMNHDKMVQYHKEWFQKNKGKRALQMKIWNEKNPDKLKLYWKRHEAKNSEKRKYYLREYGARPEVRERKKQYRLKNREVLCKYFKGYRLQAKISAYLHIQSEIKCVRCGCTDIRFLEINHKNGGGNKESIGNGSRSNRKGLMGTDWYHAIITGKRKTDDLELLCRPCNHIHFLEQKYGEKIPLKVKWNPQPELDIRNFAWVRAK